jgi:hypothetical protein
MAPRATPPSDADEEDDVDAAPLAAADGVDGVGVLHAAASRATAHSAPAKPGILKSI